MTPEELLKPRRKVIALYPQTNINPFNVGDILIKNGIHFTRLENPKSIHEEEIVKYPNIFRELEWWEDREEKDMPGYLKSNKTGKIFKVARYFFQGFGTLACLEKDYTGYPISVKYYLPATEYEYKAQQP